MSDNAPVLTLRAARLRLGADDDLERRFPARFGRIELWADTLVVEGWVRLHGRELRVHARCIEARPLDGRPAVIDVSGAPAEPEFDPDAPSAHLAGSAAAPDGRPGRDGGNGRPGGRLSVVVDEVQGELGLAANGSRGGHAERGGLGARPAPPNGADAVFVKAKWPSRSRWGGRTLQGPGLKVYQAWAAGQPGGDARRGGAAGASGRPGAGGDGGEVQVSFSGAQRPALALIADGGAAGRAGARAEPGPESAPGTGGRNRVYVYGVFIGTHEGFVGDRDDKIRDCVREHKLAPRAATGKPGAGPGPVPPPPVAQAGQPGRVEAGTIAADAAAAGFDAPFLALVMALAQLDARAGATGAARARLAWLLRMASVHPAPEAAAIAEAARRALDALTGPDAQPAPAAATTIARSATRSKRASAGEKAEKGGKAGKAVKTPKGAKIVQPGAAAVTSAVALPSGTARGRSRSGRGSPR